jgi:hypothetical protein
LAYLLTPPFGFGVPQEPCLTHRYYARC